MSRLYYIQYKYQYGLILTLNIDKSTDLQQLALPNRDPRLGLLVAARLGSSRHNLMPHMRGLHGEL